MRAMVVLLALLAACDRGDRRRSASADLPAVGVPVGPVPGPGVERGASPNPLGDSDAVVREGRRLFVWFNCAGCHGGHGGGGMGPSLRDVDWRYGSDDAHIFSSIAEGRGQGMPAWGTRIPEDQIWKIVAYIKSMRTANEPDAPHMPPEPDTPVSSTEKPK